MNLPGDKNQGNNRTRCIFERIKRVDRSVQARLTASRLSAYFMSDARLNQAPVAIPEFPVCGGEVPALD
jgi:hypothetical protein